MTIASKILSGSGDSRPESIDFSRKSTIQNPMRFDIITETAESNLKDGGENVKNEVNLASIKKRSWKKKSFNSYLIPSCFKTSNKKSKKITTPGNLSPDYLNEHTSTFSQSTAETSTIDTSTRKPKKEALSNDSH